MLNFLGGSDVTGTIGGALIVLFPILVVVAFVITYVLVKRNRHRKEEAERQAILKRAQEEALERQKKEEQERERIQAIIKQRKEQEEERWKEYCLFLADKYDMIDIKECGDLIYDPNVEKWCKRSENLVFTAKEIAKVSLKRREATPTKRIIENNKVFVDTTNIECPCVVFDCGTSFDTAKKIEATLNIFRNNSKTTKNNKYTQ